MVMLELMLILMKGKLTIGKVKSSRLLSKFAFNLIAPGLKSSLQNFYDRHPNLVDSYEISISQMTMDLLFFT
jgi:hypothetical protein